MSYYLETPYGFIHFVSSKGKAGYRPEHKIDKDRLILWETARACDRWADDNNYEVVEIHKNGSVV